MTGWIDQIIACDVEGCDNEAQRGCDEPISGSAQELLDGLREMAACPPRAWRRIGDRDICYQHPDISA